MKLPFCLSFIAAVSIPILLPTTTAKAGTPIITDDFSAFTKTDNPWGCVDSLGQIKMPVGNQLVVDDSGTIKDSPLSPSIAVGDLNGDGLPDLVVADSQGFFWYFPNHGTKEIPKFTTAEIMPIWLGDPCPNYWDQSDLVTHNIVPRIQLIDFDGDGKLDLVVGNYLGKLFYLRNQGTSAVPVFKMPRDRDELSIPTRHGGTLWCNYLAPCLYDWRNNGQLDLVLGDGTYSANSIFYLQNKGSNDRPTFSEESTAKIIPGMGREHLAPQVISWNGDGKADILCTEREGYLSIFLNKGVGPENGLPVFGEGQHVIVGGQEKLSENFTATMTKLSDSGLPGLVIGNTAGQVFFSQNTGKSNDFQFGTLTALQGVSNHPPILKPVHWRLDGGYGSPYDLLVCTNGQVEQGFTAPPDSGVTNALRFYIDEPASPNPTFPDHFYPESDLREITRDGSFQLTATTRYKLSFWVRTSGNISNLKYRIWGTQTDESGNNHGISMVDNVDASGSWELFTTSVSFRSQSEDEHATVGFIFSLNFTGKGSLYIGALSLAQDQE